MGNKDDAVKFKTDPLLTGRTDIELIRPEKGTIISQSAITFKPKYSHSDNTTIDTDEATVTAEADNITFVAPVQLPEGAIITEVIVWGNAAATAETYALQRMPVNYTDSAEGIAAANIGTADTTLTNATVENGRFHYFLVTSSLDTGDVLYGWRIKYRW